MRFKGQVARCDGKEQVMIADTPDVDVILADAEVWNIRGDIARDDWNLKNE